jgi:hypothetical protein
LENIPPPPGKGVISADAIWGKNEKKKDKGQNGREKVRTRKREDKEKIEFKG